MNRTFYSQVSWCALLAAAGCTATVEEPRPAEEVAKTSQEVSPGAGQWAFGLV